ncbi:MAG: diguanylate cyclase [Candidatus Tenebribacter davisii]|nr:diguanylate cyclase [Candidatus Tenebribacter davisii]
MKKLIFILLLLGLTFQAICLTRLDNLKLELKTAKGNKRLLILDELQKSYWKIYPQASLEFGVDALKMSTKSKNMLQQAQQLQNIAISYKHLGNYEKAFEYMNLSLRSAKKIDNYDLQIIALYRIAEYKNAIGHNSVAFDFAVQALDLSEKQENYKGLAKCHFIIAKIYYELGDIKGAYSNYEQSLDQHYNFDDKTSLALTCEKLGEIDIYNKDYYFAELHYKTAADNYNEIDNLESLVRTYQALGKIYKEYGEKEKAISYIQKFAEANEQLNLQMKNNEFLYSYEYFSIVGNKDKALKYYKLYTAKQDSLQLALNQEHVETLITDIEIKHEIEKHKELEEVTKTAKKEIEVISKTAEEKQKKIDELVVETELKERISKLETDKKNEQIGKLQHERVISEQKISREKSQRIALTVIFVLFALLIFSIGTVYMSKYKMRKKHTDELETIAKTDPLTQLPNRRAVIENISYETARFKRSDLPFTIIISDIDDFKKVNDTYGHEAGDKVLIRISELIKNSIRKQDICARWGGEEFLFLLPETDSKGGKIISEKIRKKIENETVKYKETNISISMTFGICTFSENIDPDECIAKADKALYVGKKSGKNKVVVHEDDLIG